MESEHRLSGEKEHSNDRKIKELIKNRELMADLEVWEGSSKKEDIRSINEEIKRLRSSGYSSLK